MKLNEITLRKEAVLRLELLGASNEAIRIFESGKVPMTSFKAKLQENLGIEQRKILEKFRQTEPRKFPIYMTESWHGADMISILYIDEDNTVWDEERDRAKEGWHKVYVYVSELEQEEYREALFSVENGNLWRVG